MALLPSGKPVRTRAHGPCRLIVNISSQFLHWNSRHKRRIDHSPQLLVSCQRSSGRRPPVPRLTDEDRSFGQNCSRASA